ncbi:MAG: phosphatidylglycerol lysyltransferase domain-containing protein [bacterium]
MSNSFAGTINFQNIFGNYLANFIDPTSISYYANDIIGKTYFAKAYIHSLDYVGWIILALILINSLPDNKLEPIKSDSLDKNLISEVLKYDTDSLSVFKHSSKLDYYEYKGNYIFYLVSNSFRIVLGNPIVANPDYKDCLKEFIKLSHKNGFVVAFFQVDEKFRFDLQKVGFKDILLGQEALLSLEKFDILSIENKKLKKAGDKIERGGVELEFIAYRDLKPKVIKVIESLRKDWIKSKGNRLSLTVDYWPLNNEIEGWIVLAKDSEQDYIGVGSFVPYFDQCLSFDFMIKNSQAKSQFIDGVIAKSILRFKDMGFKEMSLGIAPSEFLSQNKSANLILKLALSFQKIKYNYSGLRTFKAKFNPTWKEKYILIEGYETLPAFLAALLKGFKSN